MCLIFTNNNPLAIPIVLVVIPLIVDLAGGNSPEDDIVIRRGEEQLLSLYGHK